jgi:benzoyl-CoA reductase/2-hydroxyglutaryl-CoA dehydratase subunit BcrC/BadD/HgdB
MNDKCSAGTGRFLEIMAKCPYTYFADIIIGEKTCEGKKKMYELLSEIKDTYAFSFQSLVVNDIIKLI